LLFTKDAKKFTLQVNSKGFKQARYTYFANKHYKKICNIIATYAKAYIKRTNKLGFLFIILTKHNKAAFFKVNKVLNLAAFINIVNKNLKAIFYKFKIKALILIAY